MSLPDLTSMSPIGWVVLIAVIILCAVSVYVVEDEKKKGKKIPGHMCAGCQDNGMVLDSEKAAEEQTSGYPGNRTE